VFQARLALTRIQVASRGLTLGTTVIPVLALKQTKKPHYEPLEVAASSVIGSDRIHLPVAAKIELHSAGAMDGKPGSPTPPNIMS
jgi:hypothetical protein